MPEAAQRQIEDNAGVGGLHRAAMDFLFTRALRPDHHSCRTSAGGLALWLLYVRSHYMRMPFRLLLPHLWRKATRGFKRLNPGAGADGVVT